MEQQEDTFLAQLREKADRCHAEYQQRYHALPDQSAREQDHQLQALLRAGMEALETFMAGDICYRRGYEHGYRRGYTMQRDEFFTPQQRMN